MCAVLMLTIFACKDDFTEEDLLKQQAEAAQQEAANDLKALQTLSGADSLKYILALDSITYTRFLDSLQRADSIAAATFGMEANLPFTYELVLYNGSTEFVSTNGRTEGFSSDITVTITQYGVSQTQTSSNGTFSFPNIGHGVINGEVSGTGYTGMKWQVAVDLVDNGDIFDDLYDLIDYIDGNGATEANPDNLDYYMRVLYDYIYNYSFGNSFVVFETSGANTATLTGRAFIETDLTNAGPEVAPAGTGFTAYIDLDDGNFDDFMDDLNDYWHYIWEAESFSYEAVSYATVDANGDYTFANLPASPNGLPLVFEYSDVVANQTFFDDNGTGTDGGDITEYVGRTKFGPGIGTSTVPVVTQAATVAFEAGGGAVASANISGTGSLTDLNIDNGGTNFQGTPRVWISEPVNGPNATGGTQATATATVTDGRVTGVTLTDPGSGYTTDPTIIVTEGAGATATVDSYLVDATNGGVDNLILTSSGTSAYQSAPNVVFWYDNDGDLGYDPGEELNATNFPTGVDNGADQSGTDFPTATAAINGAGSVSSYTITNSGSTMTFTPNVMITSGLGAVGTIDVVGGIFQNVQITGGEFYTEAPSVAIPVGAGAGDGAAVLTGTVSAGVPGVTITNAGTTYTDGTWPLVFTSNGGTGATADVIWEGMGISGISINNSGIIQPDGLYYTTTPIVLFDMPNINIPGVSARAEGTAVLSNDGRVIRIDVTNVGAGYDGTEGLTLISGSGATLHAEFDQQILSGIDVTNEGSGYLVAPEIMIVDVTGGGTGAMATANLTDGRVTSVDITNTGSGYLAAGNIRVVFIDPGTTFDPSGTGTNGSFDFPANATSWVIPNTAQADLLITDGIVTDIELISNGDNYPDGTMVVIDALTGDGFDATAVIAGGKVTAVTINDGGEGYVGGNNPGAAVGFSGVGSMSTIPGITRVRDINYGTGDNDEN